MNDGQKKQGATGGLWRNDAATPGGCDGASPLTAEEAHDLLAQGREMRRDVEARIAQMRDPACGSPRCPRSQDDEVARLRAENDRLRAENAKLEAGTLASARTRDEARQALRGVELELAHTRRERDEAREQLLEHVRAAAVEGERLDARVAELEAENARTRAVVAEYVAADAAWIEADLRRGYAGGVNERLIAAWDALRALTGDAHV
jgi:cell division protein FtsB